MPGGRIGKNETLDEAFPRILKAETGRDLPRSQAHLLGVCEHMYNPNRFEEPGYGTHCVMLGYEMYFSSRPRIRFDDQHGEIGWTMPVVLLADAHVHPNTKAFFKPGSTKLELKGSEDDARLESGPDP